jgi:uncharacterized protein
MTPDRGDRRLERDTLFERLRSALTASLEIDQLPPAAHRPWPLPDGPWVMAQTWESLLFAHWPVAVPSMRALVPAQLPLDTFDGTAWIGIAPFRVTGLRGRALPAVPGLSSFPEINVRTYVTVDGKPGVYFFSLDAGSTLAVAAARILYLLPYFRARFGMTTADDRVRYTAERAVGRRRAVEFQAEYGPTGSVVHAERGSLDWWLTERYCLYAVDRRGGIYRAEIHHRPWPLQPAEAFMSRNTMVEPLGLELHGRPLLHFARRLDVRVWPLAPARRASRTRGTPAA